MFKGLVLLPLTNKGFLSTDEPDNLSRGATSSESFKSIKESWGKEERRGNTKTIESCHGEYKKMWRIFSKFNLSVLTVEEKNKPADKNEIRTCAS